MSALRRIAASAALLALLALPAQAVNRIGLAALSHDGARAILVYGNEWVEVELATGATTLLTPGVTCAWTSAVYAPKGHDFAMTAHCVADMDCSRVRTDVWIGRGREPMKNVVFVFGKRWNDAVWRPGPHGGEVLVRETPVYAPVAFGLSELGAGAECDQGRGRFATIALEDGRVAAFDLAPRGWPVAAPLAASGETIIARLRAKPEGGDGTSAARDIAALCADPEATAGDWRAPVCGDAGQELDFEWRDGDWRLLDEAGTGPGRLIVSADLSTQVRETCEGAQVDGRLRAQCAAQITGRWGEQTIAAPERFFGDLALSGDGRYLASLAAGRGLRIRRFDLFDLETGDLTDLSALLELARPWDAER